MRILLLLVCIFPSCTVHPFAYNPSTGEFVSAGSSLGTRTEFEQGYAQTSSGTQLGYQMWGKDETVVPRAYFWEKGITSVADKALGAYRSAQSTTRILGHQSVKKLGIRAARDVRLAEIAVPPEVVPAVIP